MSKPIISVLATVIAMIALVLVLQFCSQQTSEETASSPGCKDRTMGLCTDPPLETQLVGDESHFPSIILWLDSAWRTSDLETELRGEKRLDSAFVELSVCPTCDTSTTAKNTLFLLSLDPTILKLEESIPIVRDRPKLRDDSDMPTDPNSLPNALGINFKVTSPKIPQDTIQTRVKEEVDSMVPSDLKVAIIDNGIGDHYGYNVTHFDLVDPCGGTPLDPHGQNVFNLIAIPELRSVNFLDIRAFDDNRQSSLFLVLCALNTAREEGAKVVNMSFGFYASTVYNYAHPLLARFMTEAEEADMVLVASAGNNGTNTDCWPHYPSRFQASQNHMISVAALSLEKGATELHENSNYGKSTVGVATSGHLDDEVVATSYAAARVTKLVALKALSNPTLKNEDLVEAVFNDSTGERVPCLEVRMEGRLDLP